jgi:uncharacterized protein involved in exopolysaccharide biosynthesis
MRTTGRSADPEHAPAVAFDRSWRLLGAGWWLVAAGLIVGGVIGYAVSLGGSHRFQATATLYLGQPYSTGNVQLLLPQTDPLVVRAIASARGVIPAVAAQCETKPGTIRGGLSVQTVTGSIAKNGQTSLVSVSVEAATSRVAACAANALAKAMIAKTSAVANQKLANFRRLGVSLDQQIALINRALHEGNLSSTAALILVQRVGTLEETKLSVSQFLMQASQVEAPSILAGAAAQRVTGIPRRSSIVIAAFAGALMGALAALWRDRIAALIRRCPKS